MPDRWKTLRSSPGRGETDRTEGRGPRGQEESALRPATPQAGRHQVCRSARGRLLSCPPPARTGGESLESGGGGRGEPRKGRELDVTQEAGPSLDHRLRARSF